MTTLYITELAAMPGASKQNAAVWPPNAEQAVAIPGASQPFGPNTHAIRVAADSVCSINIGAGVTSAATTQARIAANAVGEYFAVTPGHKIAVAVNT
jgi:hypothetical protein